jgi:hypothetical protein
MLRCVWSLLALSLVAPLACSRGGESPAKQPDGSYRLSCTGALSDCLQRAERLCRDQGYVVAEARDVMELLGHESGESQVPIRKSDAIIYCNDGRPRERPMIEVKRDTPVTTLTPAAPPPAPAALACVPGTTQACVGPGGCSGGQACASDGSRYEVCDCGKVE